MTNSSFPLRFSPDQISIPHLVTMQFSHYYEVARWALDASAVTYREIAYALGCHAQPVGTLRANRNNRSSSSYAGEETGQHSGRLKYAVPLLCLPNGEMCRDSWEILSKYQGNLPDVWLHQFDMILGPAVRRIMYNEVLDPQYSHLFGSLFVGATDMELAFKQTGESQIRSGIRTLMDINPEIVAKDKQRIIEFFQGCDDFLQQIDDIPTHQQENPQWWIAISSLCGLLLGCPDCGGTAFNAVPPSSLRDSYQAWIKELDKHLTCQLISAYYANHRLNSQS
jgi:hypothetical protein